MDLVIDASVAAAWFFPDESDEYADAILSRLRGGTTTAAAPAIWPSEVVNSFLVAERRGRTSEAKTARYVADLADLPVAVEVGGVALMGAQVLGLAREHRLSIYDASYLELAARVGLPLATIDARLKKAAEAIGLTIAE